MAKFVIFAVVIAFFIDTMSAGLSKSARKVAEDSNLGGLDIYKILAQKPGNIVYSPLSAQTVLAFAYTGAGGVTAAELSRALRLPADTQTVTKAFQELTPVLATNSSGVQLAVANKLYTAKDVKLQPKFLQNAHSFDAQIENVDFSKNIEAAKNINGWVEERTNHKIKNLIDPAALTADTRLIALNAVYFYGKWLHEFEKTGAPIEFKVGQTVVKTPKMYKTATFGYKEDPALDATFVEIPYKNPKFSLVVVLPNKTDGLGALEAKLPLTFDKEFPQEVVNVHLPKFKIETTAHLVDAMQQLGVDSAFSGQADFSGIAGEPLGLSDVVQKAFIAVDEKGTEAAAATGLMFVALSAIEYYPPPKLFYADHPFLYYLREKDTNTILFVGRYSVPTPKAEVAQD